MNVNIPGIIPGIYFYFLTTLKYMIGHRLAVKTIDFESIIRRFKSCCPNSEETISSKHYPVKFIQHWNSVSFNGSGIGLTIPSHSIVFHDCLLNLYGWVFSIPASNQPPFHFHLYLPGFIPG